MTFWSTPWIFTLASIVMAADSAVTDAADEPVDLAGLVMQAMDPSPTLETLS